VFVIALVGIACAIAAPAAPWYMISNNVHNWTVENSTFDLNSTTTFYPGENYRFLCSTYPITAPVWGQVCTISHQEPGGVLQPYADINPFPSRAASTDLGTMYSLVWILSAFTISVGFFALAIFLLDQRQRRQNWKVTFGVGVAFIAAAAFGLGTAIGVAAFQPSAVVHDYGAAGSTYIAGSTFWGSCGPSATQCGAFSEVQSQSFLWGPAVGWYLELAAGLVFLALALIVVRAAWKLRRAPRSQVTSSGQSLTP
jgi:hypothetical protein